MNTNDDNEKKFILKLFINLNKIELKYLIIGLQIKIKINVK